jgi:diaminohydroxyphosphoribosylaminopyrimidine deaminase/5-amino-6-(5-phosphoribosylamino)uracil reductase
MVGSVIVYYDNKIIGEGWHRKGEPHAEVKICIQSVKDKSLLNKVTIYVSLEPVNILKNTSLL